MECLSDCTWISWIVLAVALLPSLITGLTTMPKAKGVVPILQIVLDLLSVVAHRDAPGTLKLPLTRSAKAGEASESAPPTE